MRTSTCGNWPSAVVRGQVTKLWGQTAPHNGEVRAIPELRYDLLSLNVGSALTLTPFQAPVRMLY